MIIKFEMIVEGLENHKDILKLHDAIIEYADKNSLLVSIVSKEVDEEGNDVSKTNNH